MNLDKIYNYVNSLIHKMINENFLKNLTASKFCIN